MNKPSQDIYHPTMSQEKWNKFSFFFQMANIGSEVSRAINWRNKNDLTYSCLALYRALELIDLTMFDQKNKKRIWELARAREVLLDYFLGANQYGSTDRAWLNYFDIFANVHVNAINQRR